MTPTDCAVAPCTCCRELGSARVLLDAYRQLYKAIAVMLLLTNGSSNRWAQTVADVREALAQHGAAPSPACKEAALERVVEAVGLLVLHADAGSARWLRALQSVREAAALVDDLTP